MRLLRNKDVKHSVGYMGVGSGGSSFVARAHSGSLTLPVGWHHLRRVCKYIRRLRTLLWELHPLEFLNKRACQQRRGSREAWKVK